MRRLKLADIENGAKFPRDSDPARLQAQLKVIEPTGVGMLSFDARLLLPRDEASCSNMPTAPRLRRGCRAETRAASASHRAALGHYLQDLHVVVELVAVPAVLEEEAVQRLLCGVPEHQQQALTGRAGEPGRPLLEALTPHDGPEVFQRDLLRLRQRGPQGQCGELVVDPEEALGQKQALHVAEEDAQALLGLLDEGAHLLAQALRLCARHVPPRRLVPGGAPGRGCPAGRRRIGHTSEMARHGELPLHDARGAAGRAPAREPLVVSDLLRVELSRGRALLVVA